MGSEKGGKSSWRVTDKTISKRFMGSLVQRRKNRELEKKGGGLYWENRHRSRLVSGSRRKTLGKRKGAETLNSTGEYIKREGVK